MHDFTPWRGLLGGALIGLAATWLLLANGRVAGISGIFGGLLTPTRGDVIWRTWFVAGLIAAGLAALLISPESLPAVPGSLPTLLIAGLCVGVGTQLAHGCTSGHGVCGISRLSPRSFVATIAFIATGVLTVAACHWLGVTP